jgi:hypothetical protein
MSTPGRKDRAGLRIVALCGGAVLSAGLLSGAVVHTVSSADAAARPDFTTQATPYHHHDKHAADEGDTKIDKRSSKTDNSGNRTTDTRSTSRRNSENTGSGSGSSSLVELNNVLDHSLNGLSLHILGL